MTNKYSSNYYLVYQFAGWSLTYLLIMGTIYLQPTFTPPELLYGLALIGSAALWSQGMRMGFKKYMERRHTGAQLVFLLAMSLIGAGVAATILVLVVFGLSLLGIVDPIPPSLYSQVAHQVFWGNAINMCVALMFWSAGYFSIKKSRQLGSVEENLQATQLEVLLQQLSPHFLFNALNNIRALILEDTEKAREILAKLADMLRYTLTNDRALVELAEELTVVEEYIDICRIQFDQRLSFSARVEQAAETALIPKMLIQLCIENSVKHGVAQRVTGGHISLTAEVTNQYLTICIKNPLPDTNQQPVKAVADTNLNIGLANIQRRLRLLYQSSADFSQQQQEHEMVTWIHLPYSNQLDSVEKLVCES